MHRSSTTATAVDGKTAPRLMIFAQLMLLALLLWQAYSTYRIHSEYQIEMMDSVTDNIISDYLDYFKDLRLQIDFFQQQHREAIQKLEKNGTKAGIEEYRAVLKSLRSKLDHSRLFSIIDTEGHGVLKHITGDFLPSCKEEVTSTITHGAQEHLFLHRSKTSVHFDLLQPLMTDTKAGQYFFVAFNTDELQASLFKYQLPLQQLFLLRKDKSGIIELSTESVKQKDADGNNEAPPIMTMSETDLAQFSFVKDIPHTRWQLAIRLAPEYSQNLLTWSILKALMIWSVLVTLNIIYYVWQKRRFVRVQQLRQQMAYRNQHDLLTDLLNRNAFTQHLQQFLDDQKSGATQKHGAVLQLDIDKFQILNNNFGYALGDKVLEQVSIELRDYLPPNTSICRLGNDEFTLLLADLEHQQVMLFAEQLRVFMQNLDIQVDHEKLPISVSVGVVCLSTQFDQAHDVLLCLTQSVALAKKRGRNCVQLYDPNDKDLCEHADEMQLVRDITQAISEERFVLYRQRVKATAEHASEEHYEVLVRMLDTEGAIVNPGMFINTAEKHGLIKAIDLWVIATTCQRLQQYQQDNLTVGINLSGVTIADPELTDQVIALINEYQIAPRQLCFEVTETAAISNLFSALGFMQRMHEEGCRFYLDDFGSGLSSISYLQKLPIDVIKIDGSFIKDIVTNSVNQALVENMLGTAKALNKRTVAEFVENQEIADLLTNKGVDALQGYHIHKPTLWSEL